MNSPLYQVEVNCPVCGASFDTNRVRSKSCIVKDRDTDFCVYYKEYNPMYYEVAVCRNCGYADMHSRFNEIDPEDASIVRSKIEGKWNGRDFGGERTIEDAIDSYKLALFCNQLRKGTPAEVFASICMRLAWLSRIKGDEEEEKRFLAYALEQYMDLYDRGRTPEKMDEITLVYLIGELNRRLGKGKDAVVWFNRVVSHKMSKQKPLVVKMAREQWLLVRNSEQEE